MVDDFYGSTAAGFRGRSRALFIKILFSLLH
jgi:hypothetical protein